MIRKATLSDYEAIYQLGETLHANFRHVYDFKELCQSSFFNILVYEEKNKIRGFLMYTNLYHTIDIFDIVVAEEDRRKKIATNLLDYMLTGLSTEDTVYLEVGVNNEIAIHLYEKFGFQKIHTRKNYYQDQDAYIMERVINNV